MSLITIEAAINNKSVTITYDPSDPEAVKAAEVWRKALFGNGARYEYKEPVAVRPGDVATFAEPPDALKKAVKRKVYTYTEDSDGDVTVRVDTPFDLTKPTPDALMNAVKKGDFYLRKVKNPKPYKTYFRLGFEQNGFDRLSPVLYIGDGLFYDYIGNFRAFDKSDYWEFASASEYRVTGTPHEPGMTPREYVKDAVQRGFQDMQKHIDQAVAAMKPWTPCKPTATDEGGAT